MPDPLTLESPLSSRLRAWFRERFPLLRHGILIVSYYSSNQFLAHALGRPGEAMHYSVYSLMGAVTLLCVFFHLRIFDEHKDYRDDLKYYPERVLQRGLVTLTHLKILGAIAIAVEIVLSALRGPAALVSLAVVLGFSLVMLKEFFVADWLKRNFLVYAVTHMFIMPLLALLVFSFSTGRYFWEAPGWYWVYAFVGFFVTFNWEISRKIRAPEEERDGVDTYTKVLGTFGAAYAVLAVRVIDTALVVLVGLHLGLPWWFYAVLVALFAVCMVGFLQYRLRPTPRHAKNMEHYAGMYIIAFDLTLALAIVGKHGLVFHG